MEWALLAILRSFFTSGREVTLKLAFNKGYNRVAAVAALTACVPALILLPYIFWDGSWASIKDPTFLRATLGNVAFNTVGQIVFLVAVKRFDISYVSALMATSPLLFGLFSFLILGELPSVGALVFMGVIIAGCIAVEMSRKEHFSLRTFLTNSGWPLLVLYVLFAAGATVFSKIAVTHGDPEAYIAYRYALLTLSFLTIHWVSSHKYIRALFNKEEADWRIRLDRGTLLAGLFMTCAVIAEMRALQLTEISRVEALNKLSIAFTLMLETVLIHKTFNAKRWAGALLILAGAVGVVLF